jgi:hypothetical protein
MKGCPSETFLRKKPIQISGVTLDRKISPMISQLNNSLKFRAAFVTGVGFEPGMQLTVTQLRNKNKVTF